MPVSLKLILVFLYFIQYKTTFLSTGVDQKVHLGFSVNLTEKPEQIFWPTQYLQSTLSFLVLSFLSQNVMCIYALILSLSVDWWLMFWLITDYCVFRNRLRTAYTGVCVCMRVQPLNHVWLFATPGTVVRQASLSVGLFSSKNTGVDCHRYF